MSTLRKVTVENLSNQIGTTGPRSILYCPSCGAQFSANSGDYWNLPSGHVFKHCRRNMWLGYMVTTFEQESV